MATTHTVKQGENLSRIARQHGFTDWRALYQHPDNAELRRLRPNPDVLLPGDEVHIPDPTPPEHAVVTGRKHTFIARPPRNLFRLHLVDDGPGAPPFAHARFRLEVAGERHEGETDADGRLEVPVPLDAEEGTLTLWLSEDAQDTLEWQVKLHHLDPCDAASGVRARLHNLGFDCGGLDGELDADVEQALRAFQQAHGLQEDEAHGPRTRAQLERVHGC